MTTERFHDDLDALLRRYDPAASIDPRRVARVSRAVLTRIAAESESQPHWRRRLRVVLNLWGGMPRYAGSLALGLALGLAVGLSTGLTSGPTSGPTEQPTPAHLYAQAQPLTPLGL